MHTRKLSTGLLLCLMCAGCGPRNDATVDGAVTYAGNPLTTGAVTFHPTTPGPPLAIGELQSDGTFTLRTGETAGLQPGEYLVTVVATGPMPEATPSDPMPLPKLLVPARYGDVKTSGLKYTISRGTNKIDIVLSE